jgi:hypothetical protein
MLYTLIQIYSYVKGLNAVFEKVVVLRHPE